VVKCNDPQKGEYFLKRCNLIDQNVINTLNEVD